MDTPGTIVLIYINIAQMVEVKAEVDEGGGEEIDLRVAIDKGQEGRGEENVKVIRLEVEVNQGVEVEKEEIGAEEWANYSIQADNLYGQIGGLKKNSLHIGASLAFAWEEGKVSKSLEALCIRIIDPENFVPFN